VYYNDLDLKETASRSLISHTDRGRTDKPTVGNCVRQLRTVQPHRGKQTHAWHTHRPRTYPTRSLMLYVYTVFLARLKVHM